LSFLFGVTAEGFLGGDRQLVMSCRTGLLCRFAKKQKKHRGCAPMYPLRSRAKVETVFMFYSVLATGGTYQKSECLET